MERILCSVKDKSENKNGKTVFIGGLPMKILRITAQGLPLFKKGLDICIHLIAHGSDGAQL